MKFKIVFFSVLFTSLTGFAQQPIQVPAADPGTDTFKWVYAAIIKPRCLNCHNASSEDGSLVTYQDIKDNIQSTDPMKTTLYEVLGDGTNCDMPAHGAKCIGTRGLRAVYWWIKKAPLPKRAPIMKSLQRTRIAVSADRLK